jgi:hypothetical protein
MIEGGDQSTVLIKPSSAADQVRTVFSVTKSTKWDQLVTSWCRGNTIVFRCMSDQVDEIEPSGSRKKKLGWVVTKSIKWNQLVP